MATNVWIGGTGSSTTLWSVAANWSEGTVPADGDAIIIPAGVAYGITGFDASAAGASDFLSVKVEPGYTQAIGSAAAPLILDLDNGTPGPANLAGTGTSYFHIHDAARINALAAGTGSAGTYGLNLIGDDNTTIDISATANQKVAIGANLGTSVEADTVIVRGGATVMLYSGLTKDDGAAAVDLTISAGIVTAECALGAVAQTGGTLTATGAVTGTAVSIYGGTTYWNSTGTITTLNVGDGGEIVFGAACTVTDTNLASGAKLRDPLKLVTFTNSIDLENCSPADVTLDIGTHITVARSAI